MTHVNLTAFAIVFLLPVVALAQPASPAPAPPIAAPAASPAAATPIAPAAPAPIARPVSFEIIDRGDAVEVIARNVKAARTAILPLRSRLQVPLAGAPTAKRLLPSDATVKLVELDSEAASRVLSVKLSFERADVKTLSRFAQAIQVGDDLHVLVPRKVPTGDVAPRLPDPTLSPELARVVARTEPPSAPARGPAPEPDIARKIDRPEAGPRATTAPEIAPPDRAAGARPLPRPDARADARFEPAAAEPRGTLGRSEPTAAATRPTAEGTPWNTTATARDDTWSRLSIYAALGLAAIGAGIWWMRRRRVQVAPSMTIEVIAQRTLGGKSRVVWLSAGPREMIVAVTGQQVCMLSQWRKTDPRAALPAAHTHNDAGPELRHPPIDDRSGIATDAAAGFAGGTLVSRATESPVSPAVSGILRLRGRTGQIPAVTEEISTGDVVADELWAREILAATRVHR